MFDGYIDVKRKERDTMRKKNTVLFAGLVLSFVMLTGCGSNIPPATVSDSGTTQKEKELQSEVDALQKELDEIKQGQSQQDTQPADNSAGTTDNTQTQNTTGNTAGNTAGNTTGNIKNVSETVQISLEEARQIALDRVPGATDQNISIHLDFDDGWYLYEGDILYNRVEYEFEIDANTGEVLKWEQEKW